MWKNDYIGNDEHETFTDVGNGKSEEKEKKIPVASANTS